MALTLRRLLLRSPNSSLYEHYSRLLHNTTGKLSIWTLRLHSSTQNYTKKSIWNNQKASLHQARVGGKLFCQLKKCLYGLKQASRAWYKDIDGYLVGNLGLTRSLEDSNLYISVLANIIILLYVDDILKSSQMRNTINTIKSQILKRYRLT